MKKFLKAVFCFFGLMLVLVLAGLFALPNAKVRGSMVGAVPKKMSLDRKKIEAPKMLLVGGSNVSFGMDSAELSRELGMPVFNQGVYAAFGLKTMLDQSLRMVCGGDVIVVFPEYEQLTNRRSFLGAGEGQVAMLCEVDRRGLLDLSGEQWRLLFGDFLGYAQTKWMKPKLWWDARALPWYAVDSFNGLGDVAAHKDVPRKGFATPGLWREPALDARIGADLRAFVEASKMRVVFMPPAYAASAFDLNAEFIAALETAMRENGTPFAAPCERYRFDDELFFDSIYHLVYEAGKERAARVAEDLKALVNKRSETCTPHENGRLGEASLPKEL